MPPEDTVIDNTAHNSSPPVLVSNRYKVIGVLGEGGFGKTFLVEDLHMPSVKRCVLKQLKPAHDDVRQLIQDRFQREAAILEQLGEAQEQIPRLYAYFSEAEQFHLVQEWVDGLTLTQKVERSGPLSEASVQSILSQLLPVIAYVHGKKIVHRDIKPDNIILRAQDELPILIDFGAVKEAMTTVINPGQNSQHSIVVGTPGFMSVEQMAGRPTFSSDVYSLGMTAIYLLTGKTPAEFPHDPQTGRMLWRDQVPTLSAGFANFLEQAASPEARYRFATVPDMQAALSQLRLGQAESSTETHLPPSAPAHRPETGIDNLPTVSSPIPSSPNQYKTLAQPNSAHVGGSLDDSRTVAATPQSSTAGNRYKDESNNTTYQASDSTSRSRKPLLLAGVVGIGMVVAGALFAAGMTDGFGQRRPITVTDTSNSGGVSRTIGLPVSEDSDTGIVEPDDSQDQISRPPTDTDESVVPGDSEEISDEESSDDDTEDETPSTDSTETAGEMPQQANPSRYYYQWNEWATWRVVAPAVYCTQSVNSSETTTVLKANAVLTVNETGQNPIQLDNGSSPSPFLRVNGPNGPCYVGAKSELIVPLTKSEEASEFLVNNSDRVPRPADTGDYNNWMNWATWRVVTPNLACLDAPKLVTADVVTTLPAETIISVNQAPNSALALGEEGDSRNKPYLRVSTPEGTCFVRASSKWIVPSVSGTSR
ncbi:MAG: serine/threonine-protein kinase [Cyanobacteria bacterium J06649_4]